MFEGKLLALPVNITLGCQGMPRTNTNRASKVKSSLVLLLSDLLEGKLLALPGNIRLGHKGVPRTNSNTVNKVRSTLVELFQVLHSRVSLLD
jgi:hypothetical protein